MSLFFRSQVSSFSVAFLCSSPLFFLLSYACLHRSSFSSSPSCPHLPPIPCDLLIPLSYSFFCPKHIFPPTRPRLIPLSLSIYLYQWAKVILSSSSRWTDWRGQEKSGAEEHSFSYFIISTVSSGENTTLYKLSFVRGDHLTWFGWLLKGWFEPWKHITILMKSNLFKKKIER